MCQTPSAGTNSTTAVTTQGLGALFEAIGTFSNVNSAKRAATANANYSERQAADAISRGDTTAARIQTAAERVKGAQRASFANHGVDVSEGSPLAVLAETDMAAAQDVATTKTNAAREAYGFRVQGQNYRSQAAADNPWLSAGAVGLAGATKVAEKWYQYSSTGAPPYKRKK